MDSTNVLVTASMPQAYCLNKDYPKAIERYEQLLQEKDSSSKPASTPESAIVPSKTSTRRTTCWKGS